MFSMAAILAIFSGPFQQTFVPPAHRGAKWNLATTGPEVSEKMDDGHQQRTKPVYTISSFMSQVTGSGELIRTEITILRFHQEMKIVSLV